MISYLIKRTAQAVITVLGVFTAVFALARLGGDPASLLMPEQATQADITRMRSVLGLDRSIPEQYIAFVRDAVQGDLGTSIYEQRSAVSIIMERLPATLQLAVPSFIIGMIIAFGIATLVRWLDSQRLQRAMLWITLGREAVPEFFFAFLLILLFSVQLDLLPALGYGKLSNLILPIAALSTVQVAVYLRLLNSSLAVQYKQDYIRTSRATGQSRGSILIRHALPNGVLPVITLAGLNFSVLLSGTVVTETVFSWPGVGRVIVKAVQQGDFPVVQAGVVLVSLIFVIMNFLVDVVTAVIDPRTRVTNE